MTTVARTLESAHYFVLRILALECLYRELQCAIDGAINMDNMALGIDVWNGTMVPVVSSIFSDEAV